MVTQGINGTTYVGASYTDIDKARHGERPIEDVFTLDVEGHKHLFAAAESAGLVYGEGAGNVLTIQGQLVDPPQPSTSRGSATNRFHQSYVIRFYVGIGEDKGRNKLGMPVNQAIALMESVTVDAYGGGTISLNHGFWKNDGKVISEPCLVSEHTTEPETVFYPGGLATVESVEDVMDTAVAVARDLRVMFEQTSVLVTVGVQQSAFVED